MSIATNKGLLVLVAINGAMIVIDKHRLFCRVDLKELARETAKQAEHAINNWGETGIGSKNTAWITGVFTEWCAECFPEATKHRAAVLVAACGMLISDLDDRVLDKNKKMLLKRLAESVAIMQDFTDENWLNFPALDKANHVASRLHEIAKENEGIIFKVVSERKIFLAPKPNIFVRKMRALEMKGKQHNRQSPSTLQNRWGN